MLFSFEQTLIIILFNFLFLFLFWSLSRFLIYQIRKAREQSHFYYGYIGCYCHYCGCETYYTNEPCNCTR